MGWVRDPWRIEGPTRRPADVEALEKVREADRGRSRPARLTADSPHHILLALTRPVRDIVGPPRAGDIHLNSGECPEGPASPLHLESHGIQLPRPVAPDPARALDAVR